MAHKKSKLADALLDAHVQFMVEELTGAGLRALIEEELDVALASAVKLHLGDLVTRDMIKRTASTYASELELGGGLPELVGEIAKALHAHEIHDSTTPGDLLSDKLFDEFLEKILELTSLREKLIRGITGSPVYSAVASDLLYNGIKGYLAQNAVTRNIPGAQSMMKLGRAALSMATPTLEASIEESLKKYISKTVKATTSHSVGFLLSEEATDLIRDTAHDAWSRIKEMSIGDFRDDISDEDIEDLFVDSYEYWRELRRVEYYRVLIEAGIDSFFDRYERATLSELLDDIGITRDMMLTEAMRYAPHVIKVLNKKKLLEPAIRRRLQGFYRSAAAAKILAGGGAG